MFLCKNEGEMSAREKHTSVMELISYPVDIATKITKFPANSYECPQFFCLLNVETQNNQEKHRQQWAPTNRFYTNLKLLQVGICTLIKLLPKSRKIHWVLDNISVVGQLTINAQSHTDQSASGKQKQQKKQSCSRANLFIINRLWENTIRVLPAGKQEPNTQIRLF
jgi:hypothetical protein